MEWSDRITTARRKQICFDLRKRHRLSERAMTGGTAVPEDHDVGGGGIGARHSLAPFAESEKALYSFVCSALTHQRALMSVITSGGMRAR